MKMVRGVTDGEDGLEGEMYCALFERYIPFLSPERDPDGVQRCAAYLNELDDAVIDHLCQATEHYCQTYQSESGELPREFATPREVLTHITPSLLIVPHFEKATPVVHMELECDWEPEHGMEWVVRNRHVLYVGPFNGEDPWGSFSPKAVWNFA
ncbi:DUF6985 domain-containing protein [Halomonas sp. GD1P12]|uniref:DUF6985 domain-containing protein n=1 Tax=Halomonas sp. GD1P12 TaxID=2982691 RepID=UPI0021E43DCC|nr:hypothetical protein [Halomonas sp. GD1P12]UYG00854.1 hypothetical protein OCT39_04625 [Halomonas sp. GD1P12]